MCLKNKKYKKRMQLSRNMIQKIKYSLSLIRNGFSYANSINTFFLDYYLRHHKIIGWHKSCPVYSSFLTPGLSKPLANTLSRRLMSNLIQKPLPGMINVAVTDICNARCEHCSFYNAMDKSGEKVMTTEQLNEVLKSCQDFGISIINFVGGEPLLRKDLAKVIERIDKSKSSCSIFTNGWFLEDKCYELKKAGLMMVIVSLDGDNSERHDKFRKLPGLFNRAIRGIKACQKIGLLTAISTTVTQTDLEDGSFEKMINFAKQLKVNELVVFDTMPIGMYSHRLDLSRQKIDKKRLLQLVDKYNAEKKYPGIFCYAHFRSMSTFGCSAGRNYFYISPYGEMHPCDFTARPIGNLLNEPVEEVWFKLVEHKSMNCHPYMNTCCDNRVISIVHKK
jgi:MoaA/NifB/PqqE/SkfB family radical SAM enzyme